LHFVVIINKDDGAKKMNKRILISALVIMMSICGLAAAKTTPKPKTLANVGGKTITSADFDSLAQALKVTITDSTNIAALKKVMLDSLVNERLIDIRIDSVKAIEPKDRTYREKRGNEMADVVFKQMYDNEISSKITVDSIDIDSFYIQNPAQFTDPEKVKAAYISIAFPKPETTGIKSEKKIKKIIEKNQKETLKRAQEVFKKAIAGENWDTLVAKYSEDKSHMKNGGDLGTIPRGRMQPEFDSVAFTADSGSIVGPVKTMFGYNIIRVDQHIPSALKPLDGELRNSIRAGVFRNKETANANKFVDSLKANAQYVYNEEALAMADSLADNNTWLVIINGQDTIFENRVKEQLPKYMRFKKITEATPQVKKDMIKDMSAGNLLMDAGKKLGYYNKPEAIQAGKDFDYRDAKSKVTEKLRDLNYKPTQDEIKSFFDSNFEARYKEKRPLHVQHIIFSDSASAIIVRDSILAGADFKTMALNYYPGEKEIREVAYDLNYISALDMGEDFFKAADSLKVNDISLPVKTQWGYHLIKLVDRRTDKTLDQVRPGIIKELTDAADAKVRRDWLEQWKAATPVKTNPINIKSYKFPESLKAVQIPPQPPSTVSPR
jgi:parvulin-like peptidyl-prolyl isomerase